MIDTTTYTARIGLFGCLKYRFNNKNYMKCVYNSKLVHFLLCSAALTGILTWTILALWLIVVEIYFDPRKPKSLYYELLCTGLEENVEINGVE